MTREEWLNAVAEAISPWYGDDGLPPVRLSVGFSSKGRKSNVIGECWYKEATADAVPQVFVHPMLSDPLEVAAVLAHELVHAFLGEGKKHGPEFRAVAVALGLTGPMRATVPGEEFKQAIAPVLELVGPYPHGALKPAGTVTTSAGPKQTTRMKKVECEGCGYTVRTTQKWLDVAVPGCPTCDQEMRVA
jgi:hypothetical protein